ncbi:hypothetical protein [Acinetobacter sp. WCHAc060042]|uniref:hypothetical protein n=1 Tax=Acinetobacter sp. WCHAc060042 TaxID=2213016 RepID=UPI000DA64A72|nr:hypothetical protein [Acinetobacter sp. WCHAc060042]
MNGLNALLKKLFSMLLVGLVIFVIHELVVRFFDLDKELLNSIAKWTFWTIAFCIAVFTPKKRKY